MRVVWQGARIALGIALLASLAFSSLLDRGSAISVHVTSHTLVSDLVQAFARQPETGVVYADSLPPSRDVATLMAGTAARGNEAVLTVPGATPVLSVTPPVVPISMRRSALGVTLRAGADTDVMVTVDGGSGGADTVSVHVGPTGTATVAVAIEPTRAGSGTWIVRALGETVTTHAWVQPGGAVRVLLLTGTPGWESRYLARALEAAGASLAVHQALGRDQAVSTSGAALPERMEDLDAWDVVALVGPLEAAPAALLRRWVTERGGGLLIVGPTSSGGGPTGVPRSAEVDPFVLLAPLAPLAQWAPVPPATVRPTDDLRWSGPVEIVPLPAAELSSRSAIVPVVGTPVLWSGSPRADADSSADAPAAVYASADWVGRGRIFASGIESWPWAMEAGLVDEHRRYWESVVEWLAGGLTSHVSLTGDVGRPGVAWMGRLESDAAPARSIRLVPTSTGGHPVGSGGGEANLGVVVVDGSERASWTDAALEIGGAGGLVLDVSSTSIAPLPGPLSRPATRRWLLFLALGGLAVVAWTTRRVAGYA